MSDDDDYVSVHDVSVQHMTAKALLVMYEGEKKWIPLSQVHPDSEVYNDTSASDGVLMIPRWLAEKCGFADSEGDAFDDAASMFDQYS